MPNNFQQQKYFVYQEGLIMDKSQSEEANFFQTEPLLSILKMEADEDKRRQRIEVNDVNAEQVKSFKTKRENQEQYIEFLRKERSSRLLQEKEKIIEMRMNQMKEIMKEKGLKPDLNKSDDDDPKKSAPVEYDFALGMVETKINAPIMTLPQSKDQLFVVKALGKYDPRGAESEKTFHPQPKITGKKPFPKVPKNHMEERDIN
jgi:hypothetical protein